jgi:hypothetical protein
VWKPDRVDRRRFLAVTGGALAAGAAGVGVLAATGEVPLPRRLRARLDDPGGTIPPAAAGEVRLDTRRSAARRTDVGFFTAVPAGHGDGAGLPVCLVLHGASATTADFEAFGLPQFLTAAVESGVPPFVLAGVDGGVTRWEGGDGDDPQAMLRDEVPAWCADLGFDTGRVAAHGWSMGGYGALLAAASNPGWLRATAVLSPAVGGGRLDSVVDQLEGRRTAVWCGTSDPLYDDVRAFVETVPGGVAVVEYAPGAHTRTYWNTVTIDALRFVGRSLA